MAGPRVVVTRRWPPAVEALSAERFEAVFDRDDKALSEVEPRNRSELRDYRDAWPILVPEQARRTTP